MDTGYVFVAQQGSDGPVKIDFAPNVRTRLVDLQRGNPTPFQLRVVVAAHVSFMKQVRADLKAFHIHDGWYDFNDSVRTYVAALPKTVPQRTSFIGPHLDLTKRLLQIDLEQQWEHTRSFAHQLHTVWMHQNAPICLVLHGKVLEYSLHLDVGAAYREGKEAIDRDKAGDIRAACFWQRQLEPRREGFREWRHSSSAGICPGGCHAVLPA